MQGLSCPPEALKSQAFLDVFQSKNIQVIAPASGTAAQKLSDLEAFSPLKLHVPPNILQQEIPYHASGDPNRLAQLKQALLDPNPNTIIWTLRGGYGSARLIDSLLALPKPAFEKTFIGFSDITALHLFLSQHWQWRTIHGAGISQIIESEYEADNFLRIAEIVQRKSREQRMDALKPYNVSAKAVNSILGGLTGGNLSIVESSIGTAWQIETEGRILMLEDVGEKGYRVDRSLNHLKQAGLFQGAKAIVFGQFTHKCPEEAAGISLALERFAKESEVPVYKTECFGHGKHNCPWVYQANAEIFAGEGREKESFEMRMGLGE